MPIDPARTTPPRALPAALRRTLHDVFGRPVLRATEEAVIRRALDGADTLAVLAPGIAGALCAALPALRLRGPVLVVWRDDRPPAPARNGLNQVVFVSAERLADATFVAAFQRRRVALVVVDEAQRLSRRSPDFEPARLALGRTLRALHEPPVLALAAAAPREVVADLRAELGRPDLMVIDTGLYRENLRLRVMPCARDDEKLRHLLDAMHRTPGPGIVYTTGAKAADRLHELLRSAGESVSRWHGKLAPAERSDNRARFADGTARVMVATNGFAADLDRLDLRFVVHWQMPPAPVAYYEEAGHAGRDGRPADAMLLFDRRDHRLAALRLARHRPAAGELARLHQALVAADTPLTTPALLERLDPPPRDVNAALEALRAARAVSSDRHRAWHATPGGGPDLAFDAVAAAYAERLGAERGALDRMLVYARTERCRWHTLLECLGEVPPFATGRCGHCDNCLRSGPASGPTPDAVPAPAAALR